MQSPPAIVYTLTPQDLAAMMPQTPLVSLESPSQDTRGHRILRATLLAVGAVLDTHSSHRAYKAGLVEQNAWLYGRRPSLGRLVITKALINGAMWFSTNAVAKNSKADAFMPVAILSGKQIADGVMNYQNITKQKERDGR